MMARLGHFLFTFYSVFVHIFFLKVKYLGKKNMKLGQYKIKTLENIEFYSDYLSTKEKIKPYFKSENVKKNFTGTINLQEDDFLQMKGTVRLFFSRNKLNSISFYPEESGGAEFFQHLKQQVITLAHPDMKEGTEHKTSYYFPDAILIISLDPDGDIVNIVLKGRKES